MTLSYRGALSRKGARGEPVNFEVQGQMGDQLGGADKMTLRFQAQTYIRGEMQIGRGR